MEQLNVEKVGYTICACRSVVLAIMTSAGILVTVCRLVSSMMLDACCCPCFLLALMSSTKAQFRGSFLAAFGEVVV